MYYLAVYECSRRVFSVEINIFNFEDLSDERIDEVILGSIERAKERDGLKEKKHKLKSVMISIDKEMWIVCDKLQF